jgi:hypothetical protein
MKNGRRRPDRTDELEAPDMPHFIVDEDEPACLEYVLMREQDNMPALREYMLELHTRGGIA